MGRKLHSSCTAPVTRPAASVLVTSPKAWSQPWLVPTRTRRKRVPPKALRVLYELSDPLTSLHLYSMAAGAELMMSPMMEGRLVLGTLLASRLVMSPPAAWWMTSCLVAVSVMASPVAT